MANYKVVVKVDNFINSAARMQKLSLEKLFISRTKSLDLQAKAVSNMDLFGYNIINYKRDLHLCFSEPFDRS
jgi:hypothetical protein